MSKLEIAGLKPRFEHEGAIIRTIWLIVITFWKGNWFAELPIISLAKTYILLGLEELLEVTSPD